MKIKALLLIASIFVILGSCTKDVLEPKIVVVVPNTSAAFSTDVYPIFASNGCTVCHPSAGGLSLTGGAAAARTSLIAVGAVIANSSATSPLYTKFKGVSHNGKTLNTTELSNIKGWIDGGAKAN